MSRSQHVGSRASFIDEGNFSPLHKAYIALGSNLDDRQSLIELACHELDQRDVHVRRTSSLYETKPMYYHDQYFFLNGICEVSQAWSLLKLLKFRKC